MKYLKASLPYGFFGTSRGGWKAWLEWPPYESVTRQAMLHLPTY
jgi:hypothetical protein